MLQSKCTQCGYTADPQDRFCPNCSNLQGKPMVWVKMVTEVTLD